MAAVRTPRRWTRVAWQAYNAASSSPELPNRSGLPPGSPLPAGGRARSGLASIYSHSRLSCFENCPKRFEYRYVLGLPVETESIEAFLGRCVHRVLERLHRFVQRGSVPALGAVLRRFHADWEERFDPNRIRIARSGESASSYLESGERCLRNHFRRHYPFDGDQTLALEQRVSFTLDEAKGYNVQGVIDRVARAPDGALEIQDYKTGQRIPPQRVLDEDRQLALYQLAMNGRHGEEAPVRLVWHYLLFDQTRVSKRTPEQLEELRGRTVALIDRIEAERRYEPKPGPLCSWCEYSDACPASAAASGGRARSASEARSEPQASEAGLSLEARSPQAKRAASRRRAESHRPQASEAGLSLEAHADTAAPGRRAPLPPANPRQLGLF